MRENIYTSHNEHAICVRDWNRLVKMVWRGQLFFFQVERREQYGSKSFNDLEI